MTRRIACAILMTVWVMLITSGVAAYFTTRAVLLRDLDDTLLSRASALPELVQSANAPTSPLAAGDSAESDRHIIQGTTDGRTFHSRQGAGTGTPQPESATPVIVSQSFSTLAGGLRVRSLTIRALARPVNPGGTPLPVLVTYTRSAEPFHQLLERLAWTLTACCLLGGLAAAGIAYGVSYFSLRPLRHTAELVGEIDERHLDRRIPTDSMPRELLPVAGRLNEMLGRLQQSFSQRRKFLADASHELRTPVAALVTGLEVSLARQRQAESYRSALSSALIEASQLRSLVERLMEQVRAETFSHDERWQNIDISALLDECVAAASSLGAAKGIGVRKDYPAGLLFSTQPGRLRSVITNVLSNAVEYNRSGGFVDVIATVENNGLELDVRDTGVGIDPAKLPDVFEPFFRGDESHRSDSGHLGLGLALVRSHLDAMNGRCTVESEPGVGSTFRIRLPQGARQQTESRAGPAPQSREKVLAKEPTLA